MVALNNLKGNFVTCSLLFLMNLTCSSLNAQWFFDSKYDLTEEPKIVIGSVNRTEMVISIDNGTVIYRIGSREIRGNIEMRIRELSETTFLAKNKKRIKYLDDSMTMKTTIAGETSEVSERGPMDEASVIGELSSSGLWKYRLEYGTPNEQQESLLSDLELELDDKYIYPQEPIKIGHTWNAPPNAIQAFLGSRVLNSNGSITMTFEDKVKYMREECARIRTIMQVQGTMLDASNTELQFELSVQGMIYRSLESFYDLSGDLRGTVKFEGQTNIEGSKVDMKISGPIHLVVTQ